MTSGNVPGRTVATADTKYATAKTLLDRMAGPMADVLPEAITPKRMAMVALTEMRLSPKLFSCSPESLVASIMQAAQLGLEPGNALGHCYLVPYGTECRLLIGYRGMIHIAMEAGTISSIYAELVRDGDYFEEFKGTDPRIDHRPSLANSDGKVIGVYAVAQLRTGAPPQFEVLNLGDIQTAMDRSEAANSQRAKSTPWYTDWNEMTKKTAVRRLFKYLPLSNKAQSAASQEELIEIGKVDPLDTLPPGMVRNGELFLPEPEQDKPPSEAEVGVVERPGVEEEPPDDGDHSDAAAEARFGPEKT